MSSLLVDIGVRSDLSHVVITRLLQLQVEVQRWMSDALLWKHRIGSACICRSFAITEKGYMGLMPEGTVAVAELVLFVGMQTPVVVRGDGAQSPVRMRAQLTGETAQLHRRTFDLAWETVREAQAALTHERPELRNKIIAAVPQDLGPAGWDGLHFGFLAGARLELELHELDRMYMREAACRGYDLSEHISLRLHLPLVLSRLKTLGYGEFELPEWMFDLDYPGHYPRRIKNVSVTIPCIVGPYVGIHCRLQLLSSGIRLVPTLPTEPKCCCQDGPRCIKPLPRESCKTGPMASWISPCAQPQPICTSAYTDPETLQRNFLISEAIATSTGQNGSGVFELSLKDDNMRAPFEFAGVAASRWRVELPPHNNAFDLESLTDFVLHINYTAKQGGAALRDVADRAILERLPGDGLRFFDVRSEFASAWSSTFAKQQSPNSGERKGKHYGHGHDTSVRTFPLQFVRRAFPFLTGRPSVIICGIDIFVETERPCDVDGQCGLTPI